MFYAVPTARVIFKNTGITCHRPTCYPTQSHYTDTRPTCYVSWSLLHPEYHASRDHSHFQSLWYDWTQHQPGIEPTNPLGQCWVPPMVALYNQQGLLRTYSSPGGSIRSPHLGSPQGHSECSGKKRKCNIIPIRMIMFSTWLDIFLNAINYNFYYVRFVYFVMSFEKEKNKSPCLPGIVKSNDKCQVDITPI